MDVVTAVDTLQAIRDTIVVGKGTNSPLDWLSFGGTALVAIFTGGYLYYTYWIYRETQKQARSAEATASASQKAAKASQESLREQRRVNEQRSIERTHPLLWLDIEDPSDGVVFRLQNNSGVPAMNVSMFICARYLQANPLFGDASSTAEKDDIEEAIMTHEEYGKHTGLTTEVIEGRSTQWTKIEYKDLPIKLYVLIQYRNIHGDNFGRYFEVIGSSERERQDSVDHYFTQKTVPIGVSVEDRYEWVWREGDEGRREMLVRELDLSVSDWDVLNEKYIHSDDRLQANVGTINASLTSSVDTREISSVKVVGPSEESYRFDISFPRNWDSFEN